MWGRLHVLLVVVMIGLFLAPANAEAAKLGVGIDRGQISLDKALRPGEVVHLPAIGVFNTGDAPATYSMDIAPPGEQEQLQPKPAWFTFSPMSFPLTPGAGRRVEVTLKVPMRAVPGDYFVLVRAFPETSGGMVAVGVAAASKVRFTVRSGSLWTAIPLRVEEFLRSRWPWSLLVPLLLLAALVLTLLPRRFRFRLLVTRRGK